MKKKKILKYRILLENFEFYDEKDIKKEERLKMEND